MLLVFTELSEEKCLSGEQSLQHYGIENFSIQAFNNTAMFIYVELETMMTTTAPTFTRNCKENG